MVIFIIVPVVLLIYFHFRYQWTFSFTNYQQIFTTKYLKCLHIQFYMPLITIITLAISYPAAYYITRSKFQNILLMIMIIPTWINLLLKTYAFIGLLSHDGVINQFSTYLIYHHSIYYLQLVRFSSGKLYLYTIYDFTYI